MSAGFFTNCFGLDGWGKRLAVTAFLLLVWLSPSVYAAAAGVIEPFPDKGEDPARPKRPVLPEKMTFPGTISYSAVTPGQVHPIYPHDGAIFPPNAAVTVSWRMPDQKSLPDTLRKNPKYFMVSVTSNTHPVVNIVKYFPYNGKSPTYNGIFNIPTPGRYGWQTTAIMDDDTITKSPARYFVVKEPYYYNHYFNTVQDIYPHYYYDSQDHRR